MKRLSENQWAQKLTEIPWGANIDRMAPLTRVQITQLVIADTDEWDFLIECDTREANAFLRHHLLHTNRLVFVHIDVEYKHFAVGGERR